MNRLTLIDIDWNCYNGFSFRILGIDYGRFEGDLLGMSWGWRSYFQISILFFTIEIKKPWYNKED